MTQKDKDLLLKDLCGRLPYGVMIQYHTDYDWKPVEMYEISCDTFNGTYSLELCKPYLRSMDDMTEEEKKIQKDYIYHFSKNSLPNYEGDFVFEDEAHEYIDWLKKNHFDYRGLIERGIAIEVTEENNPYNLTEN